MDSHKKEFQLLVKVLRDLRAFSPSLVLVGGWVPYLYQKVLWKHVTAQPLATADIDFALSESPTVKNQTIAQTLMDKNYGERHVKMGKSIPFVPVAQDYGLNLEIEFIVDTQASLTVIRKIVGREIKINPIDHVNVLLSSVCSLSVESISVQVPTPEAVVFHKLLTFTSRVSEKQFKDLYYAYYILFFSPEQDKVSSKVTQMIKTFPEGMAVRKNIQDYFGDPEDRGSLGLVPHVQASHLPLSSREIREDACERFQALLPHP